MTEEFSREKYSILEFWFFRQIDNFFQDFKKLVGTSGRGKRTLFLFMFKHLSFGQDVSIFSLYSFLFSIFYISYFCLAFDNIYLASNLLLSGGQNPMWKSPKIAKKRANKMTTNHIYFCFSPHFWLRINLDLFNGDYINFNLSGFSRMKSRSSRTTLWCLIVIIRKCFVSRCPNMCILQGMGRQYALI